MPDAEVDAMLAEAQEWKERAEKAEAALSALRAKSLDVGDRAAVRAPPLG